MKKTSHNKGALASGPVRRWSKSEPKLLATNQEETQILPSFTTIKKITLGLRFIVVITIVIITSLVGAGALLGTTVLPMLRIDGHNWLIQRSIYVQGQVPLKAVVLSLGKPLERTTISRFNLLLKGAITSSIVEITALPLDKIIVEKTGNILVNKKSIGLRSISPMVSHTLGDSYLAICLSGACGTKNRVIEIPSSYVLGKVLGEIHLGIGLGSPPSYKENK